MWIESVVELSDLEIPLRRTSWMWVAVIALLVFQFIQMAVVVHRESLTWDEDNHMFAGYMMWQTGDYGLNPEHPPLVKLLATVPMLGRNLWVPELKGRDFKAEAYLDGRDWVARNDGDRNVLVFQMRLMAGLLALGQTVVVFLAARRWFGETAGLVALALAVFEPNIAGHSALVTTDVGVSLFFLASIFCFYQYVVRPTVWNLALAGVMAGLLLASKHSGILLAPMLVLLICWEVVTAERWDRGKTLLRLSGALAAVMVIGVAVLWAFYGFRYAARPVGLRLSTSLADYTKPLGAISAGGVLWVARWHLLPESYLMGLVDVKRMAQFYPTFVFGKVYAHGQWWYFPAVIAIKTTLGMLALCVLAVVAVVTGKLKGARELAFLVIPGVVYLGVAMASGMNIGARHILPLYALAAILCGGAVSALAHSSRRWAWVCGVLIAAHVGSSLAAAPNFIPYGNEAWGGSGNTYKLLSDASVDWAQQLYQVKAWEDGHPGQECWFAYFANPVVEPSTYGIKCHTLPTIDTFWMSGESPVPAEVKGYVLVSAGDLSGCEWPSGKLNPYEAFQALKPEENIDGGVLVYEGEFDLRRAAGLSRAEAAFQLLWTGKAGDALPLAREAVAIDPGGLLAETALGDSAAATGQKEEARKAWTSALESARKLEPDAQVSYVPELEEKLRKM